MTFYDRQQKIIPKKMAHIKYTLLPLKLEGYTAHVLVNNKCINTAGYQFNALGQYAYNKRKCYYGECLANIEANRFGQLMVQRCYPHAIPPPRHTQATVTHNNLFKISSNANYNSVNMCSMH